MWNAASPTAQKQKSPLAVPLHKFHQTDQNERIAFRGRFFSPLHTVGYERRQADTLVQNTKNLLTCLFDCTSDVSKYSTNLLEIIDFYRFSSPSILHEHSETEKAGVRKGNVCIVSKCTKACWFFETRHVTLCSRIFQFYWFRLYRVNWS